MSAQHTPGPWYLLKAIDARPHQVFLRVGIGSIEVPHTYINPETPPEMLANAHLIAAAPELIEAAQKALNFIANTEGELGMTLDSGDALRAAIAKAKGETP